MNPASVLHLDGLRVPVEIGGSSRKARLTIESDGSLRLRAAADVAAEELRHFLASKRDWIYRKLAEKEAFDHEPTRKELVDGEAFSYLGRNYRLKLADVGGGVRLERGRLVLPTPLIVAGEAQIIEWYCTRRSVASSAGACLVRTVARRARQAGSRRPRTQVGERNRWQPRAYPLGEPAAVASR